MPTIKAFRDTYSDKFILNFYRWSGDVPVNKGTFVKIAGSGWTTQNCEHDFLGSPGASFNNTVSVRYGVNPLVAVAGSGDAPIGMLLNDVRETDENGEKLVFNPRKKAELQAVCSGEPVPILTKGIVLYSGIDGTVTAGSSAYVSGAGQITATAITGGNVVGKFLGKKDNNGWALVRVDL